VTVEYPKEKLIPYPRFRGSQALLSDPETGATQCVACMLGPTIPPAGCIHAAGEQTPDGRSRPASFEIDLSRCIFCGLCEEVCPVAAIVMTSHYELSTYDRSDLLLDKAWLMANAVNVHKEVFAVESTSRGESPASTKDTPAEPPAATATPPETPTAVGAGEDERP
jgi:NADH-quinone oxidoreductase subunit I